MLQVFSFTLQTLKGAKILQMSDCINARSIEWVHVHELLSLPYILLSSGKMPFVAHLWSEPRLCW